VQHATASRRGYNLGQGVMKARGCKKRAILPLLKWGEGGGPDVPFILSKIGQNKQEPCLRKELWDRQGRQTGANVVQIMGAFHSTKNPEIPGEERMERTLSRISFWNFRCTSQACPNIPENRNNRKILFHSTIPSRPSFSEAWLPQCFNVPNPVKSEDLFCK